VFYKLAKSLTGARETGLQLLLQLLHLPHEADLQVLRFFTTGFRQTVMRHHIWESYSQQAAHTTVS
jgi:hypothetical protein